MRWLTAVPVYNEAKHLGIKGRSSMRKDELERAVDAHKR